VPGSATDLGASSATGAGGAGVATSVGGLTGGTSTATGAGAGAAASLSGGAPGTPDVQGTASTLTPGVSSVSTFEAASAGGVQGAVTVDTAANAAGAGESVGRVQSAQGSVAGARATAQDPSGAATAAVDTRVTGAVSERAPVDPGEASARVGAADAAFHNPEEAAEGELRGAADARVRGATPTVQVEGSVSTTPTDPKK
jgi:hypothetical protein